MPRRPINRQWRIKEDVFKELGRTVPGRIKLEPQVEILLRCGLAPEGTSNEDYSNVIKRKELSKFLATCVIRYYMSNPELLPAQYSSMSRSENALFSAFFEYVPDLEKSYSYTSPSEANDMAMRGLRWIGGALLGSVVGIPEFVKHREKGRCDDIDDYLQLIYSMAGFTLSKNNRVTNEEAIQIGLDYFGDQQQMQLLAETIIQINRDCIRYSILGDEKVGVTAAFPISDEAYEAAIRGEHDLFSFTKNEIVHSSNNILLLNYADCTSRAQGRVSKVRWVTSKSFLTQIALLMDPTDKKPLRFISFTGLPVNTGRLLRLGFKKLAHGFHPTVTCNMVVLDSAYVKRTTRMLLPAIDNLFRYIRNEIDKLTHN